MKLSLTKHIGLCVLCFALGCFALAFTESGIQDGLRAGIGALSFVPFNWTIGVQMIFAWMPIWAFILLALIPATFVYGWFIRRKHPRVSFGITTFFAALNGALNCFIFSALMSV